MCEVSIAFIIISSSIISNLLVHLKPGSILVKVGDKVERGQWIACCGNSGNTSEITFSSSDGMSFYTSAGLPIEFIDTSILPTPNIL